LLQSLSTSSPESNNFGDSGINCLASTSNLPKEMLAAILTPLFLWMSWHVASATQTLTTSIVDGAPLLINQAMNGRSRGGPSVDAEQVKEKRESSSLTSIPACRKTLRAEKNNRYFDFKHLKICAHLNISYNF
jgi:hypothetical protein